MSKLLSIFIGISLLGSAVWADPPSVSQTIVGLLNRASDGSLSITLNEGGVLPLSLGNPLAAEQVRGLQNMDFLQGSAEKSGSGLILSGVDFVGLNRLLGAWYGSDSNTYDFTDFSSLTILTGSETSGVLSYALSPQSDGSYKFFIAKNHQVLLYTLIFQSEMAITLTTQDDVRTALTLHKINP